MLTWEGSWPNSLARRPPWLQACSVKNKQTRLDEHLPCVMQNRILMSIIWNNASNLHTYLTLHRYLFFDKFLFLNYEIVSPKLYNKSCTEPHSDHCLSKFDRSRVINLKKTSHFFILVYTTWFSSRNHWTSLKHHTMANIWEKAISILAANLSSGFMYYYFITTVTHSN